MTTLAGARQLTLREAHSLASAYWDTKGGTTGTVMAMRAAKAVERGGLKWDLPITSLTAVHATQVLTGLRSLALSSRATYFAAFKRMVELSGKSTVGWPGAGVAPRRSREPLCVDDLKNMVRVFELEGWHSSVLLAGILYTTGMRVEVEALSFDAWEAAGDILNGGTLRITGKGGHQRIIPVGPQGISYLKASGVDEMRRLSYSAHLKRWNKAADDCAVTSRLPTPHAVRHLYATEAYARSGKNLHVVKELLGHADINTTARYIGVDMEELRHAAGA